MDHFEGVGRVGIRAACTRLPRHMHRSSKGSDVADALLGDSLVDEMVDPAVAVVGGDPSQIGALEENAEGPDHRPPSLGGRAGRPAPDPRLVAVELERRRKIHPLGRRRYVPGKRRRLREVPVPRRPGQEAKFGYPVRMIAVCTENLIGV